MQQIRLYQLNDWMYITEKPRNAVIYSSPCETLLALQEKGHCVLAELSHLQGLSEQEAADALNKETAVVQYQNVCFCAKELPQAYLRRIWCRAAGLPVTIAKTQRLTIRESIPEDAEAFRNLYQDQVCLNFLEHPPVSCGETVTLSSYREQGLSSLNGILEDFGQDGLYNDYRSYIKAYLEGQYAYFEYGMWTVIENSSGDVIGRIGIEQSLNEGQQMASHMEALSLGYALLPQYRGVGYALEACRAVLSYCRECEYTEHIAIVVDKKNIPSMKLAQRLQAEKMEGITVHILIK